MPKKLDLKGQTFGQLTVVKEAEPLILKSGKPRTKWVCRCSCGNETIVSTQSLIQGTTVSCGCYGHKVRAQGRRNAVAEKLVGRKVGRWTIESYAGTKTQKGGQTRTIWNCVCDCGTKRQLTTNQLKEGSLSCGCLRSELTSQRETFDLTGRKINYLTVVERIGTKRYGKNKNSTPLWKCKCECGKECVATSMSLIEGKKISCGCKRRIDIAGEVFGALTALDYDKSKTKWRCRCACGNITYCSAAHLRAGNVISCGCKSMSKGESIIYNFLKQYNIRFKKEYSFQELKGPNNGLLRFDFAVLDSDELPIALIEYQGEQHYVEVEGFGDLERDITDFTKRLYCDQTHIPLYYIYYDSDIIQACKQIISSIHATYADAVPSFMDEVGVTTIPIAGVADR